MLHKINLEIKKFQHFLVNRIRQKKVMIYIAEFFRRLFKNFGRLVIQAKKIILKATKMNL